MCGSYVATAQSVLDGGVLLMRWHLKLLRFDCADPGLIHSAVLRSLVAGERYYYTFGDDAFGYSEESSFEALPFGGKADLLNFYVFGGDRGCLLAICAPTSFLVDHGVLEADGSNPMLWVQPVS